MPASDVLAAVGVIATVLALLAIPGFVAFHRRYVAPRRILEQRALLDTVSERIDAAVAPVKAQLANNGGSSFRDSVERRLDELKQANGREFREIRAHLGRQDTRIDGVYTSLHEQGAQPRGTR